MKVYNLIRLYASKNGRCITVKLLQSHPDVRCKFEHILHGDKRVRVIMDDKTMIYRNITDWLPTLAHDKTYPDKGRNF